MSTWKKSLTLSVFMPIILAFISCGGSGDQQFESPPPITATQLTDEPEGTTGVSNNNVVDPNVQVEVNVPVDPVVPVPGPIGPSPIPFPSLIGFPAGSGSAHHRRDHGGHHDDDFCSADADCPTGFVCVDNFCRPSCELVSISISVVSKTSIAVGTELQLIATGTYIDGSTRDITSSVLWSSSNTAVATVSNAPVSYGLVTAIGAGFTEITAAFGAISASFPLTVTSAVLVSIEVTPTNPSIANGTTEQFTATGVFSDGTTQNLTSQVAWSSSSAGVATVSNAAGTQGLATGVSPGTSIITAALDAVSGNTTLTVTNAVLISLAVTPPNPSIAVGTTQQFIATGTFSDGSTQNLTSSVTWASSDNTLATISNAAGSNGLATGVAVGGPVTISATLGAVSGNTSLTVTVAVLVSIDVTPSYPVIANGTDQQFTATGTFSDGSTQDLTTSVTWASSVPGVATISINGLATSVAPGSTSISATLGAISGNTTLTVTNAVLISLAVMPPNPSIAVGTMQQFIATGTFSDGSTQNLTSSVTWASSDNTFATISNAAGSNGLATSVAPGSTSISATLGAVSGSTTLTVTSILYAILDIGTPGSIVHNVVLINYSDPNNISYVPFGTIAGFADKYFVSATLDPVSGKIFVALSDSDSTTSVTDVYLYSVTFPDLLTVTPFSVNNTVYINLNPQVTYDVANDLFYYAVNNDPLGYDYTVNTIDSSGNVTVTSINTSNIQNSGNGLQIFNNFIYATYRPGNSFTVDFAGINDNTTGSITSPITPQPPGQLWSVFDSSGVLWGTTQFAASSLPSYSLYKLQCTTSGLPASSPFPSELVGTMPTTFETNFIANITLFTPAM